MAANLDLGRRATPIGTHWFRALVVGCGVGRFGPHTTAWVMHYGARPLRLTVHGLLLALLVIVSVPADVAAAVGLKVTLS